MNIILGSGIVGLLAREVLGPSWTVIPFYKSRYYSFNPPLADNFVCVNDDIESTIKNIVGGPVAKYPYKRAFSVGGELVKSFDEGLYDQFLAKTFGASFPRHAKAYDKDRMTFSVYDIRVNQLYKNLQEKNIEHLKLEADKGQVTEIGPHYLIRGGERVDFENAVSTIPLNVLCQLMGREVELPSKDLHYLHIHTKSLDFEGANQVLVVDNLFSFFKATRIAPHRYLIYCHEEIPNPGEYFMYFLKDFDLIDGTSIKEAMPLGSAPDTTKLEDGSGIHCIGSNAQWDWCADVGSCLLRIIKYANRGFKPKSSNIYPGSS